jgi:hypothetical protein
MPLMALKLATICARIKIESSTTTTVRLLEGVLSFDSGLVALLSFMRANHIFLPWVCLMGARLELV